MRDPHITHQNRMPPIDGGDRRRITFFVSGSLSTVSFQPQVSPVIRHIGTPTEMAINIMPGAANMNRSGGCMYYLMTSFGNLSQVTPMNTAAEIWKINSTRAAETYAST